MKGKNEIFAQGAKILTHFGRYKYVLLIILVGIVFLIWPNSSEEETEFSLVTNYEEGFSVDALENKLSDTLSKIDGAGNVEVILTVQSGIKRVLAQDGSLEQEGGTLQREMQTVVISMGSGRQETVLVQQIYPKFQGALVVADGGGDPNVRLKLTQAVAALTGLGSDKISICKGK